jgi:serine-type D-Ala-D-Ala carboxypeptidase/endopeptidase (penicillin-binding protein 4)
MAMVMGRIRFLFKLLGTLAIMVAIGGAAGWCDPARASRSALELQLRPLVGPADAVMIVAPGGALLVEIHADQPLIPASILKVLTSLAALHYLGESYRFPTDFYLSPEGNLKVKGYGDPLLVSERLAVISRRLAEQITHANALVVDDSYIEQPVLIPGRSRSTQPYDAPNGALCVNFNTVNFTRQNGRWISAEPQTPLLESTIAKIKSAGLVDGRITLAASGGEGARYAGELLGHFLEQAGVSKSGAIIMGTVDPQMDHLLWRYESEDPLTTVINGLLVHSNNFIANQLILAMGAQLFGPPATLDKGVQALRAYYQSVAGDEVELVEGSGISRRNRISARSMMGLLALFEPHSHLMRHEGRQWYKTGTLSGIRTRAGYLDAPCGGQYRFVVMINTPGRGTDRIMRIIETQLH